ncbi:Gfo/Idh/MocA family protein [Saccharopolyspora endophytica]|uniref:Gfo/Idh/MocA family oxidoreductase n=1 Tax=Saccharopolyspora endophytica TaxID=543886 RepID=A0ABS5DH75_9PSEU|nr:Gfo/Idh/MocA family oxidoreductase [Saccharopolyspora endophytica]MBQ0925643.1 Gfo/Idh/MocA family oxidoreductase [Saccharopolyspora endophytica]
MTDQLRAGLLGAGFMGSVHAHAIRAAGATITAVSASTPERSERAASEVGAGRAVACADELIHADDVDVVHICTPNALHVPQALAALDAGKHVICEKPLATTEAEARQLADAARDSDVVTAVPFIYRFYPSVREARARIAAGEAGALRLIHGSYLQDWMAPADAGNWRSDASLGGASRAFADIGIHWCDLIEFTTGHRITRLIACTVATSSDADGEDATTLLFETDRGAAGSAVISQVSQGRKNRLWFSIDGATAAYSFNQEQPDTLWIGGQADNRVLHRGSAAEGRDAVRYSALPAGHPQGYQDCFNAFVRDTYASISDHAPDSLPTFDDGLRAAALTQAVLKSADTKTWVEVPR